MNAALMMGLPTGALITAAFVAVCLKRSSLYAKVWVSRWIRRVRPVDDAEANYRKAIIAPWAENLFVIFIAIEVISVMAFALCLHVA